MITDGRDIDKLFMVVNNVGRFSTQGRIAVTRSELKALYNLLVEAVMGAENPYPTHKGKLVENWDAIHHAYEVSRTQTLEVLTRLFNIDGSE